MNDGIHWVCGRFVYSIRCQFGIRIACIFALNIKSAIFIHLTQRVNKWKWALLKCDETLNCRHILCEADDGKRENIRLPAIRGRIFRFVLIHGRAIHAKNLRGDIQATNVWVVWRVNFDKGSLGISTSGQVSSPPLNGYDWWWKWIVHSYRLNVKYRTSSWMHL